MSSVYIQLLVCTSFFAGLFWQNWYTSTRVGLQYSLMPNILIFEYSIGNFPLSSPYYYWVQWIFIYHTIQHISSIKICMKNHRIGHEGRIWMCIHLIQSEFESFFRKWIIFARLLGPKAASFSRDSIIEEYLCLSAIFSTCFFLQCYVPSA